MTGSRNAPRPQGEALVVMPTYNEAENLRGILTALFEEVPSAHVLVADDNSPDGTGELADRIAAQDSRVQVLHRPGKAGLAAAYVAGFEWGLARGYPILVEMDADGSHPASSLPAILAALQASESVGVVIGSRWVPGGSVVDWPLRRELLSRGANTYARLMLGIAVRDSTGGFRAFRADTLRGIGLGTVDSLGYCFQVDMTLRVLDAGFDIVEVPITFKDRQHGVSKMSGDIVFEAMRRVTIWGIVRRWHRITRRPHRSHRPERGTDSVLP